MPGVVPREARVRSQSALGWAGPSETFACHIRLHVHGAHLRVSCPSLLTAGEGAVSCARRRRRGQFACRRRGCVSWAALTAISSNCVANRDKTRSMLAMHTAIMRRDEAAVNSVRSHTLPQMGTHARTCASHQIACAEARARARATTLVCAPAYPCTHTYAHTHTRTRAHAHTHTRTHAREHIYTNIHIHMHTQNTQGCRCRRRLRYASKRTRRRRRGCGCGRFRTQLDARVHVCLHMRART